MWIDRFIASIIKRRPLFRFGPGVHPTPRRMNGWILETSVNFYSHYKHSRISKGFQNVSLSISCDSDLSSFFFLCRKAMISLRGCSSAASIGYNEILFGSLSFGRLARSSSLYIYSLEEPPKVSSYANSQMHRKMEGQLSAGPLCRPRSWISLIVLAGSRHPWFAPARSSVPIFYPNMLVSDAKWQSGRRRRQAATAAGTSPVISRRNKVGPFTQKK